MTTAEPGLFTVASDATDGELALPDRSFDPHGPLAARMRPRSLDEVAGQQHLLGPGAPLWPAGPFWFQVSDFSVE